MLCKHRYGLLDLQQLLEADAIWPIHKKKLFVSCNGPKNRVGRSVKHFFLHNFFDQKCVLCMFYVDWELGGR